MNKNNRQRIITAIIMVLSIIALLLVSCDSYGQSVSVNHSLIAFGKSPGYVEAEVSHKNIGIHYFFNYRPDIIAQNTVYITRNNLNSTPAISYTPINISILHIGGIASLNKFPTKDGTNFNFYVELSIPIRNLSIDIKHISNGFGLLHDANLGYDAVGVKYKF